MVRFRIVETQVMKQVKEQVMKQVMKSAKP